jgi:transposase
MMSATACLVGIDVAKAQLDIALRPTGERWAVVAALAAARLPVAVVNPRHARAFAKATGQLAKTDALDARALAYVAEAVRPTPRPLPDAPADELRALLARRRQRVPTVMQLKILGF